MSYHRIAVREQRLRLGTGIVYLNALHGIPDVHQGEAEGAYEDVNRNVRVSPYAVLHRPRLVLGDLMRLSRGRWTQSDAVAFIAQTDRLVRTGLAHHQH